MEGEAGDGGKEGQWWDIGKYYTIRAWRQCHVHGITGGCGLMLGQDGLAGLTQKAHAKLSAKSRAASSRGLLGQCNCEHFCGWPAPRRPSVICQC